MGNLNNTQQLNNGNRAICTKEHKVYRTLRSLSKEQALIVAIPLGALAKRTGLSYASVQQAIRQLIARGVILYFPGKNQWITSCFILINRPLDRKNSTNTRRVIHRNSKKISGRTKYPGKIPNVKNVNDYINIIIDNVRGLGSPSSKKSRSSTSKDALAFEIAETFNDVKNLALYLAYCRRYSAEIIHRAFKIVKETPMERIKRSKGAFFTYLVKRYAQQEEHKDFGN